MSQSPAERREYQRWELERPMVGRFGSSNILIINIGLGGALLEHHIEIPVNEKRRLTFNWGRYQIQLTGEIVRSVVERFTGGEKKAPVYRSGIKFLDAEGESDQWLREMIAFYVTRALAVQKANARGVPFDEAAFVDPSTTRLSGARTESAGYISCRFDGSGWKRMPTLRTVQPPDGFTVAASEPEIDLLCQNYEKADEAERRMIRMMAELSVMPARPPSRKP